jgi:hypothetical protein
MATRQLETLTDPAEGLAGPDFYAYYLDQKNLFETNDQYILDLFRTWLDRQYGRGVVAGTYTDPLLVAGTGTDARYRGAHVSHSAVHYADWNNDLGIPRRYDRCLHLGTANQYRRYAAIRDCAWIRPILRPTIFRQYFLAR